MYHLNLKYLSYLLYHFHQMCQKFLLDLKYQQSHLDLKFLMNHQYL